MGYDALGGDTVLTSFMFIWNYDSPTCTPTIYPTNPTLKSTSGAILIASNAQSDFALLRLTEDPKYHPNITVSFLGWDKTGTATAGGVGIHHPLKKVCMKI